MTNAKTATVGDLFHALRESVERNMELILSRDDTSHYPAAILILVASEALSRLRGKSDDCVFAQITERHGLQRALATDLFDALRNGLTHIWDTNFLDVGGPHGYIELVVSRQHRRHLSKRTVPSLGLNVNIPTMWGDLREAFAAYAAHLATNPADAAAAPPKQWQDKWIKGASHNSGLWCEIIDNASIDNTGEGRSG